MIEREECRAEQEEYQGALERITILEGQVQDYEYQKGLLLAQIAELDNKLAEIIRLQSERAA